ncbi:MerR family transcriptional regulator [Paenibacillus dendritiformis]|uniref:MerR family transcriptional regulator n=1 Tax=Paenibacillus dendritiformis TaxID=130049 RepID=UPI00143D30D0|nr:MerR family transcriptional regulator [Paenibacillus dendritiformis]NKI22715.1 MerR family transcriptional regulator [Paenibacillus dendritiformis]NRG01379.1 MerR family transcriptional regulator [Paenibacillus dendritiformis]
MFRIGEFSKLTQVSIRMLRYYDEVGLLKPARVDKLTGYRLYSIEQIPMVQQIILLRDMEFSVAEIAFALANWDDTLILGLLENKKKQIQAAIRQELERIAHIDAAMRDIREENLAVHYNVTIKRVPSFKILSLRRVIPNHCREGELWKELFAFIEEERIDIPKGAGNIAIFHDPDHRDADVDVEVGLIVNQLGEGRDGFQYRETEAIDMMACVMVYGPFGNIARAYHSFAHWLEQHQQYEMAGLTRQICHKGPFNEPNPANYLTEVQTPVMRKGK